MAERTCLRLLTKTSGIMALKKRIKKCFQMVQFNANSVHESHEICSVVRQMKKNI